MGNTFYVCFVVQDSEGKQFFYSGYFVTAKKIPSITETELWEKTVETLIKQKHSPGYECTPTLLCFNPVCMD